MTRISQLICHRHQLCSYSSDLLSQVIYRSANLSVWWTKLPYPPMVLTALSSPGPHIPYVLSRLAYTINKLVSNFYFLLSFYCHEDAFNDRRTAGLPPLPGRILIWCSTAKRVVGKVWLDWWYSVVVSVTEVRSGILHRTRTSVDPSGEQREEEVGACSLFASKGGQMRVPGGFARRKWLTRFSTAGGSITKLQYINIPLKKKVSSFLVSHYSD
ncbi:hypothetical protein EGR_08824 [Echinococcus granulosus]|uniref:Uncharacterized protein n=1 Tax=Echinococcus granulosus TaxID=6210 RepID=W6US67_ECHGR|nr:hypothetical protein EGR_08824 [Echinococcus granulosus]EUB56279.1 hypothetical protein EGR_08824 [Echinococcus granulosus]